MKEVKLPKGYEEKFFLLLEELQGEFNPDCEVQRVDIVMYPWRKQRSEEIQFLTPAVIVFVENTQKETKHVVVYAWNGKEWTVFCGDSLFNKKTTLNQKEIYGEYVKLLKELNMEDYAIDEKFIGIADYCVFWKKKDCRHVRHSANILNSLNEAQKNSLKERLREIREKLNTGKSGKRKDFSVLLKNFAFKVPVLIEGEQGSGKTHTAFKVAEELANKLGAEVIVGQGDNSVEATDLLGYWIKDQTGNLVWKDGVLTESFRKAQKGKVILIFDEFYRLRDREKDIFVRALTVFPDGKLRLRTGRVIRVEDGVAVEEVIEIPKENLWVIATTNVGAQFMVDEADPALKERFIILRKDTTEEELREILKRKVREKGFSQSIVETLIKFYRGAEKLFKNGELSGKPTTRTLVRAVELSESEEEVKDYLWEQRYLWIGRDSFGYPIKSRRKFSKSFLTLSSERELFPLLAFPSFVAYNV